jgi:hypothetical protein
MSDPPLDPLQDLREQFRAAAAQQIERERRPRWQRRGALVAVTAAVATGGAAVATDLISTGDPVPRHRKAPELRPTGLGTVAVTARDEGFPVPWGVVIYRAANGDTCALAGQIRGSEIGVVEDGVFRPFEARSTGACGDLERPPHLFVDLSYLNGRTLLYGRSGSDVARIRLDQRGERPRSAPTGAGGAYLFVLEGRLKPGTFRLTPLGRDGAPVG